MRRFLALLILLPIAAYAASAEDEYIAARDAYIAQFRLKENEQATDEIAKAEIEARGVLEKRMQAIIGAAGVKDAPAEGKLNAESLITGDVGFGQLEGLRFALKGNIELLVTTRTFLERWLKAQQEVWRDSPDYRFSAEIAEALRAPNFYTQAMSNDAAVTRYADIPAPEGAVAMLIAHQQDIGAVVPKEMIVAVLRGERVFVFNAPVTAQTTMIAACKAIFDSAMRKAKAAQKSGAEADDSIKIETDGDAAMRQCYNDRAKAQPFFPALIKQAQDLVERTR